MWLAYVDESYNVHQHWVAAVLISEEHINTTHRALREVVAEAADAFGIDEDAELHGHELYHGEGPFEPMKQEVRARIGVYGKALECLAACDCRVILRGVAIDGLKRRYGRGGLHPQRWVVEHLLERIDEFCEPDQRALVVADQHELSQELLGDLRRAQDVATRGYRARKIQNVVDTLHFVSSETNHLVQAADLVVFLRRRMRAHYERDIRAIRANARLWEIIAPHVAHEWIWHP